MVDGAYSESNTLQRLSGSPRNVKTAFAAAAAERLWPLVLRYASTGALAEPLVDELRRGLDDVWSAVRGEDRELTAIARSAEDLVPYEDEHGDHTTGYAGNAIAAIAYAARTWMTDSSQEAVWATRQLYEAGDLSDQVSLDRADGVGSRVASLADEAVRLIEEDLQDATSGRLTELEAESRGAAAEFARAFV